MPQIRRHAGESRPIWSPPLLVAGIRTGTPNDHDRTRPVVRALLADRSEQQSAEAAHAARADDEQVGILGGLDENRCRGPLNGRAFAFDSGVGTHDLRHGSVEQRLGAALETTHVDLYGRSETGRG